VRVLRSESAKPASYRRREPEKTLLHRTIREHLSTFLRDLKETDVRLPRTVTKELQAYLSCGQLSSRGAAGGTDQTRGHPIPRVLSRVLERKVTTQPSGPHGTGTRTHIVRRSRAQPSDLLDRLGARSIDR